MTNTALCVIDALAATLRRGSMLCKILLMLTGVMATAVDAGAFERTIPAPDGVGDVAALTNALKTFNALSDNDRKNARIWLAPGLYDLRAINMSGVSHLVMESSAGGLFAGKGAGPEDTVLLGNGATGKRRVLQVGGAGNYGWMTVSNLTITGGYTTGAGGGVFDAGSQGTTSFRYLIVSNNYASGAAGGGGCYGGRAYNCLFMNNKATQIGGGFATSYDGYQGLDGHFGHGAFNCKFRDNDAKIGGGLYVRGGGRCQGCTFYGNAAKVGSALRFGNVNYTVRSGKSYVSELRDCSFLNGRMNEYGGTGTVWCAGSTKLQVSNCTFVANKANGGPVLHGLDMMECSIFSNTNSTSILSWCNLERCIVSNNVANGAGTQLDTGAGTQCTNSQCVFVANSHTANGNITYQKRLVNCTYLSNVAGNGNYGGIIMGCPSWNCIFFGNTLSDGSAMDVQYQYLGTTASLVLTNCLFKVSDLAIGSDGYANHSGVANSRSVSDVLLSNYVPKGASPARDAGLTEDWLLGVLGVVDFLGRRRFVGSGVDVGACEYIPKGINIIIF